MKIRANGIEIEVEDSAAANPLDVDLQARPAVLLIMGLGMQLVAWPPQFIAALVDAGYRVVCFDNRDMGLSTHLHALGTPNLVWALLKFKLGIIPKPPYTLSDMAQDAIGVLDALDIPRAHVVGVSMGGMIAQRVAIAAPKRVLSLTSIMSSSGAKGLPQAQPKIRRIMLSRPRSGDTQAAEDHLVRLFKAIGSPAFPTDEAELRTRIQRGLARGNNPKGVLRQMMAIVTDITRAAQLSRINSPTLVVHGKADPLVPYACAEDTAARIAGSKLLGIEGMGHDLPPEPVARILDALIAHLQANDISRIQAMPTRPSPLAS